MLNSLLYVRGDAEKSGCKTDRNINKQINIVTIFIQDHSEIIKLINNQFNKNEPGQCPSTESVHFIFPSSIVPYFDAYAQEKFNPQILQWQWYQKKDDGYGLFSCNKPDISLSLSVVPSQFNQMLLKGGFFSTHLHTVSKAS